MIDRTELSRLSPAQRAEVIYARAHAALSQRLWQAALGAGDRTAAQGRSGVAGSELAPDSMLALLLDENRNGRERPLATAVAEPPARVRSGAVVGPRTVAGDAKVRALELGASAGYGKILLAAEARTGIPASALASVVNAEAATRNGRWDPGSRNPRSSAAGLGQFLSSTWQDEAARPGSWLNETARARGWLDGRGRPLPEARNALLELRYDAEISIHAIADYAKANLEQLRRAGVRVGGSIEGVARAIYVAHHLGVGDAIRFMTEGLQPGRAARLLGAQIGAAGAVARAAAAGGAAAGHQAWLLDFIGRKIRPEQFQIPPTS